MLALLLGIFREIFQSIFARYGDRIGKTTAEDAKANPRIRRGIAGRIRDRLRANRPGA